MTALCFIVCLVAAPWVMSLVSLVSPLRGSRSPRVSPPVGLRPIAPWVSTPCFIIIASPCAWGATIRDDGMVSAQRRVLAHPEDTSTPHEMLSLFEHDWWGQGREQKQTKDDSKKPNWSK